MLRAAKGVGSRDGEVRARVSLRVRLTLWVVAIYTLIHWAAGGVLWLYQSSTIDRVFDELLRERAEDIATLVAPLVPGMERERLQKQVEASQRMLHGEQIGVELFRRDGTSVFGDGWSVFDPADVPIGALLADGDPVSLRLAMRTTDPAGDPAGRSAAMFEDPSRSRVVAVSMLGADLELYVLVVGSTDGMAREQLAIVGRFFVISALAGPLVALVCGWFIAGIAVAPIDRLRRIASQFGPDSLDRAFDIPVYNTEVQKLRDELDLSRLRIREAFEAQGRLLSNVSHELKTPIAVILAEGQTMNLEGTPAEVRGFVDSTLEEMQRLGRLVESFLTLARLQDGPGLVRHKRYAVNDLVMDAVEACAMNAEHEGVRLSAELLEDEDTIDAGVAGEPDLLRNMIENLIRNALRFTPEGGRVLVRAEVRDDRAVVRVIDEGPGIPEDQIGLIFDRFSQADNQTKGTNGHGLGLAIAQEIARLHGGTISASNRVQGGCVFSVQIPLEMDG